VADDQGAWRPHGGCGYYGSDYWSWRQTWGKLVAELAPGEKYLKDYGYNCRIGYPLEVLQSHIAKLGKDSPYIKQWLHAQNAVMEACSEGGSADLSLPDPMTADHDLALMQANDRAYQRAAIAFYRAPDKALELFRAIGSSNSEHKAAARYNVASLLANAKQTRRGAEGSECHLGRSFA